MLKFMIKVSKSFANMYGQNKIVLRLVRGLMGRAAYGSVGGLTWIPPALTARKRKQLGIFNMNPFCGIAMRITWISWDVRGMDLCKLQVRQLIA